MPPDNQLYDLLDADRLKKPGYMNPPELEPIRSEPVGLAPKLDPGGRPPALSQFGEPAPPRSVLGDKGAPGQQISDKQMPQAQSAASAQTDPHQAILKSFGDQKAALDHIMPTNVKDPNMIQDLNSYRAARNAVQENEAKFKLEHPWGTPGNHPGFWGKFGHTLATIGNVAGEAIAPNIAAAIPGSHLNLEQESAKAEQGIKAAETEQADVQTAQAAQTGAEARKTEAATDAAVKPRLAGVAEGELGVKDRNQTLDENTIPAQISNEALSQITNNPDLSPEDKLAQLVKIAQDMRPRTPPNQDDQKYEEIVQRKKLGQPVSPEDGAWAGAYEKRKTLSPFASAAAQAPQHATERSDRSFQTNVNRTDKVRKPIDEAVTRLGRLQDTLNQHNPQADALVAPELLSVMAGGQGSGVRMNEAEIARIVGGRSAWETLKSHIQHWQTNPDEARSITPDQDRQIRALVDTVHQKLTAKQQILDDAEDALSDTDNPKEHRQIVNDARKKLDAIDLGQGGAEPITPTGGGGRPSVAEWLKSQKK